jgi:SAM-dependent methyltransferase
VRFGSTLPAPGSILDVASGTGRHARWFAERGHSVTAVDRDFQALASLDGVSGITLVCEDLEGSPWPFPSVRFDAIVVTNYLHRPLFPYLLDAVDLEGLLIYETFAAGNEMFGKPSNPAFLLNPGELLDLVSGHLRVIAYEDVFLKHPKPAMVQRLCARRQSRAGIDFSGIG